MSSIKGVKVGSTQITSTYVDQTSQSDSKPIEVIAVELKSIGTPSNTIYTGIAQTPTPEVKATVGGVLTTLEKDRDYTLSYENNTNTGTAKVTATGIGNFKGSVWSTWEISNAEIAVTFSDQTYAYNGLKQGLGVSASAVSDAIDIKYGLSEGTYDLTESPRFKNVSESGDVYFKVSAPNHNTVTGHYSITIRPKTAVLQWGENEWVYDGEEHSTTCVVDNLVSGDSCSVVLIDNSATNIGNYVVTAESLGNSNYVLPSTGNKYGITIKPGLFIKISGSWVPVKAVYEKISGSWVKKTIGDNTFDIDVLYMNRN